MLTSPFIDAHVDINTDRDDADRDDHTSSCSVINENNDQLDTESPASSSPMQLFKDIIPASENDHGFSDSFINDLITKWNTDDLEDHEVNELCIEVLMSPDATLPEA